MKKNIIETFVFVAMMFFVVGVGSVGIPHTSFAQAAVTIANFNAQSNIDGNQIAFTASATGASTAIDFDYSFVCGLSASTINGPSSSFSVPMASVTSPLALSGTLTIGTPYVLISPTQSYYCEIFDGAGTPISSPVMVSYGSGQLSIPYVTNVTDATATISINLGSASLTPYLYYGDSPTTLSSLRVSMNGGTGATFSGNITGLKANTTYYYQVFNGTTSVPYGDAKTFTTIDGPGTPPSIPLIYGTIPKISTSEYNTKDGIVNCGKAAPQDGQISDACDFAALLRLIDKFIGYLIFIIAPGVAALTLAWGGFLYATSGFSSENKGQAKGIMMNALIGWILAFAAWIIVKFVMVDVLGYDEAGGWLTFW